MTLFRVETTLWKPSSSSSSSSILISDTTTDRYIGQKEEERENVSTTERRQARRRNKLTQDNLSECNIMNGKSRENDNANGDREEFFQISLTSNAIRQMIKNAAKTTSVYNDDAITHKEGEGIVRSTKRRTFVPPIIRLYNIQQRQQWSVSSKIFTASITDGTTSCLGNILQIKEGELEGLSECIVSVAGFVMGTISADDDGDTNSSLYTSENENGSGKDWDDDRKNAPKKASISMEREIQYSPYIFITRYELLFEKRRGIRDDVDSILDKKQKSKEKDHRNTIAKESHFQDCKYQKRGRLASLISSHLMDDLINEDQDGTTNEQRVEDRLEVSNFLEQHAAIMALKSRKEKASLLSSSSFSLMLGSLKYFQTYASAINEFDQIQRGEQFTSLSDMTEEYCIDDFECGEEASTGREEQSLVQNTEALENALQCKDDRLSCELILKWQAWLLGGRLDQEVVSFRSEKVGKRVAEFCDALERHWVLKSKEDISNPLQITSLASAAMLGFLDIVPFEVGNQRLARILLNWVLRKSGLPFCITLYSNREEKQAYLSAIRRTRQNLCLVPQGHVDDIEIALILRSRGGLLPLASYLLNRLARATVDLCVLVERKALMASEETDARLVRQAREQAARCTCIICFEDKPNISTLCCGKPIHLNCLAQWLKSNSSCPQCRADLPPLSVDQGSNQRRDDRRYHYGPPISVAPEEDSITDEFLFHSSSSSSSSESQSSSSSSSSESSGFFYSGLGYSVSDIQSITTIDDDDVEDDDERTSSIRSLLPANSDSPTPLQSQPHSNYVTSDEEEQGYDDYNIGENNGSSFSNRTYVSETDDGMDRYSFHTNDSQRSLVPYESNFELARNDNIDIVSDSQSTGSCDTSVGRDDELIEDSSVDERISQNNENSFRETQTRTSSMSSEFVPFRMSFLDPELLGSVQNVQDGRTSSIQNDQLEESGNILDPPEVARPEFLRATDDVHPNLDANTNSCDFPPPRGLFSFSRRSRWS